MAMYASHELNNNTNGTIADLQQLFDCKSLGTVDLTKTDCPVAVGRRPPNKGLHLRPLQLSDFHKGYMDLLSQLTDVGVVDEATFYKRFRLMQSIPDTYYILVVEDVVKSCLAATCTLVVERKFIHSCGCRARVEDLVVQKEYRNRNLAKALLHAVCQMARNIVGCYKISLECVDSLVPFYEKFGFCKEPGNSNFMVQRFH